MSVRKLVVTADRSKFPQIRPASSARPPRSGCRWRPAGKRRDTEWAHDAGTQIKSHKARKQHYHNNADNERPFRLFILIGSRRTS